MRIELTPREDVCAEGLSAPQRKRVLSHAYETAATPARRGLLSRSRALVGAPFVALSMLIAACSPPAAGPDAASDGAVTDVAGDGAVGDASGDVATDGPITLSIEAGCNPIAVTRECMLPFPSDFVTREDTSTPTGRRLAIPQNALRTPEDLPMIDMAPFNRADGSATTSPILVHFGADLGEMYLVPRGQEARSVQNDFPIALFDRTTGRRVPFLAEMDANRRGSNPRYALIIRPLAPLAFGARYAVAIRRSVRTTTDMPLPESPGFVALRDGRATNEPRIESARPAYDALFRFLAEHNMPRAELALAWEFNTASERHVLGPIRAMRRAVFDAAAATPPGITFRVTEVRENPNDNTARIVLGSFTPPNYLREDSTIEYGPDALPVRQTARAPEYPFTMVIPKRFARERTPMPLVLFGHGVFGTGREYLTGGNGATIQAMAERVGGVVIATDWIGLSGGDRDLIIDEVVPNINRIGLVTDRLLQSLVNNLALIELAVGRLNQDPMVQISGVSPVDPTRVYYYGVSLGGIQGSSLVSVSRHVQRAVFSVPGGAWATLLTRSIVYQPIKQFVDLTYPDPLLQQQFIGLLQSRFDHADPANLSRMMFAMPPEDAPRSRRVVMQEAIGDCLVPNLSTEILARAMGVRLLTAAVETPYGLDPIGSPTEESALSQIEMTTELARYRPPTTNTVPTMDNGVHSGIVPLPNALQQVEELFSTGRVQQFCEGTCNPQ